MSDTVVVRNLTAAIRDRGSAAYILTVSDRGTPHVIQGDVRGEGDQLVAQVGERTAQHARVRPEVSLLYPFRGADDYSLIVDATATVTGGPGEHRLILAPTRAVLHRPGPAPDPASQCGADCVPLSLRPFP